MRLIQIIVANKTLFCLKALAVWVSLILLSSHGYAHGFNADYVYLTRLNTGIYRVTIKYTHVELGEYREAHIDFSDINEAQKIYQQLKDGADFFLGDLKKSLHFHKPSQKNQPY